MLMIRALVSKMQETRQSRSLCTRFPAEHRLLPLILLGDEPPADKKNQSLDVWKTTALVIGIALSIIELF